MCSTVGVRWYLACAYCGQACDTCFIYIGPHLMLISYLDLMSKIKNIGKYLGITPKSALDGSIALRYAGTYLPTFLLTKRDISSAMTFAVPTACLVYLRR